MAIGQVPVALDHRQRQWRPAGLVLDLDVGAVLQQQARDLGVTLPDGIQQSGLLGRVDDVDLCTLGQQYFQGFNIAVLDAEQQGRHPVLTGLDLEIRTFIHK